MSEKVTTAYGEAELPALIKAYENMKKNDERKKHGLRLIEVRNGTVKKLLLTIKPIKTKYWKKGDNVMKKIEK